MVFWTIDAGNFVCFGTAFSHSDFKEIFLQLYNIIRPQDR